MKLYVINLMRSCKRRKMMETELSKVQFPYEIIEAIDALDIPDEKLHEVNSNSTYFRNLRKGELACLLSHKKVLQRIVDEEQEMALVLEDDMILSPNLNRLLGYLHIHRNLFKNDIIMLSASINKQKNLISVEGHSLPDQYSLCNVEHENLFQILGAMSYIISQNVAQRILSNINEVRNVYDDWNWYKEYNCYKNFYFIFPFPVLHGEFLSDVNIESLKRPKSLKEKLKYLVYRYEVPFVYDYFLFKRRERAEKNKVASILFNGMKIKKSYRL